MHAIDFISVYNIINVQYKTLLCDIPNLCCMTAIAQALLSIPVVKYNAEITRITKKKILLINDIHFHYKNCKSYVTNTREVMKDKNVFIFRYSKSS